MKWYFALNNKSENYRYLAKVAVQSAAANTSLRAHCIYDGGPDEFTSWLESHGVEVIYHRVSFIEALEDYYPADKIVTASGAFLRCDIPIIEEEDDYVLYTDCDVIFLRDVSAADLPRPKLFACSTEFKTDDWSYFNSGVMVMNIRNMREDHAAFTSFIKGSLPEINGYDQEAYNQFYGKNFDKLDPIYNWKQYWDRSEHARIIHFHGPKPKEVNSLLRGEQLEPICHRLFYIYPIGFRDSLELFAEFDRSFIPYTAGFAKVVLPEVLRMKEEAELINKEYRENLTAIFLRRRWKRIVKSVLFWR